MTDDADLGTTVDECLPVFRHFLSENDDEFFFVDTLRTTATRTLSYGWSI